MSVTSSVQSLPLQGESSSPRKVPKPRGSRGPKGYNLRKAMGINGNALEELYKAMRMAGRALAGEHLGLQKPMREQELKSLSYVVEQMVQYHPILARYEGAWPAYDIVDGFLKSRIQRQRATEIANKRLNTSGVKSQRRPSSVVDFAHMYRMTMFPGRRDYSVAAQVQKGIVDDGVDSVKVSVTKEPSSPIVSPMEANPEIVTVAEDAGPLDSIPSAQTKQVFQGQGATWSGESVWPVAAVFIGALLGAVIAILIQRNGAFSIWCTLSCFRQYLMPCSSCQ